MSTHVPWIRVIGAPTHGRAVPHCPCGWTGASVNRSLLVDAAEEALRVARDHVAEVPA